MFLRLFANKASKLIFYQTRYFPRIVSQAKKNPEKIIANKPISRKPGLKEKSENDQSDPEFTHLQFEDHAKTPMPEVKHEDFVFAKKDTEEWNMSDMFYPINKMPDFIMKVAQKVFSHYSFSEIRQWGYLLKQNYQRLSSCEHPSDISKIAHFANTDTKLGIKLVKDFKDSYKSSVPLVEEENKNEEDITKNKDFKEKQIFRMDYKQAHAVAYLYKKFPHSYFILLKILSEIRKRRPEFIPLSCLDFGAGLGSGIIASAEIFPRMQKLAACEPSNYMRQLGKLLTKELKQDVLWADSLSMIPGTGSDRGKFDIVIISQVLEEINSPAERISVLEALWSKVNDSIFI